MSRSSGDAEGQARGKHAGGWVHRDAAALARDRDRLMSHAPRQSAAEPCRAQTVVLDFDGTLTDAAEHAPAFHAASGREFARRLVRGDADERLLAARERRRG